LKLRHLDLFSGIGGFSLGLERTGGFETVGFCDNDKKTHLVLKKHWPNVPIYDDVSTLKGSDLGTIDIITGGFPCQDLSVAGKGAGLAGARSGLWFEFHRLIKETQPKWVIAENVAVLRSRGLDQVLRSLDEIGYDAEWHCIPASAVGAPHRRDRIWIVAYPSKLQCDGSKDNPRISVEPEEKPKLRNSSGKETLAYSASIGSSGQMEFEQPKYPTQIVSRETIKPEHGSVSDFWKTEPQLGRVADGIPNRLDRLKQLGNSLVPQIPEMIGYAILQQERNQL
jgi:DNA (cytosine-5)-methyltransferase 1